MMALRCPLFSPDEIQCGSVTRSCDATESLGLSLCCSVFFLEWISQVYEMSGALLCLAPGVGLPATLKG